MLDRAISEGSMMNEKCARVGVFLLPALKNITHSTTPSLNQSYTSQREERKRKSLERRPREEQMFLDSELLQLKLTGLLV